MIYSEGLIRARETIAREIKEINENMDDDTIVAIAKTQDECLTSELTDQPTSEDCTEQNENMMKRLSVGLLSRRSSKKDGQEMNSATNSSESSQDTNIPTAQRRIRRVTFSGYNKYIFISFYYNKRSILQGLW